MPNENAQPVEESQTWYDYFRAIAQEVNSTGITGKEDVTDVITAEMIDSIFV